MTNPELTIIVPVFNLEKHISNCIESILDQDFENYELLLINDGSKDGSDDIINNYAIKDNRIQAFHQKNKGVSAARNLGLEKAKGNWICFIDGDDTIYPNSLAVLMKAVNNHRLEMVIARSYISKNGNLKNENYEFNKSFLNKSFDGYELIRDKFYKRGSVCGCIFKNNLLKTNNINFPLNLEIGEDSIFVALVYLYSQNIVFSDQKFYLINEREGSASRSWTSERIFKMTDNLTFFNNYLKDNPQLSEAQIAILNYNIYSVVSALFNNFYYCFSFSSFFKIIRVIKKRLPRKIETLDIQMNKSKVKLLNFSLTLFAISVILKQIFSAKNKKLI